jgi:L-lactate utilization protein LutB
VSDIVNLLVVEPSSNTSKHRAAAIFARKEHRPDVESVREHLKEVRAYSRDHHVELLEKLKKTFEQHGEARIGVAADAAEAAEFIRKAAGETTLASINKSNVVVNELRPDLHAAGLTTYLRYYTEFKNFGESFEKKVEDYWSLPGMHGRGLVETFDVKKSMASLDSTEVRDYVAILSVNAISAEDGSVFFLQHMSNISKDLDQARKIVLVVSLEKIVKDREAALAHTQAMGVFGLESILLDLEPKDLEAYDFDALPILPGSPKREISVLIFDNGRSALLDGPYADLSLCIDCRACARQCPIGQHTLLERAMVYSPKNYLLGFLQGWLPTTDACLHCGRCEVECPVDIDIPTLIWKAQLEHYEKHGRSLKKKMLDDPELLGKLGTLASPLSNWATGLPIVRWVMQMTTGVHTSANLPAFRRQTFRDWYKKEKHG